MEKQENQRIIDYLSSKDESVDTITKKQLENLLKIDSEIQKRIKSIAQAKESIKENTINISVIAKATGISNKTFYNNTLLREYVEEYSTKSDEKIVLEKNYNRLKEQNEKLTEQIKLLFSRDIDFEKQRHEIDALHKEINALQIQNNELQEAYEKLICDKQRSSSNKKNNVISLVKNTESDT